MNDSLYSQEKDSLLTKGATYPSKKKSRNTAEILLYIFPQNFRTAFGDKKV